jgi:F0F1-type ATP synthase membrane subunit b/b'
MEQEIDNKRKQMEQEIDNERKQMEQDLSNERHQMEQDLSNERQQMEKKKFIIKLKVSFVQFLKEKLMMTLMKCVLF